MNLYLFTNKNKSKVHWLMKTFSWTLQQETQTKETNQVDTELKLHRMWLWTQSQLAQQREVPATLTSLLQTARTSLNHLERWSDN